MMNALAMPKKWGKDHSVIPAFNPLKGDVLSSTPLLKSSLVPRRLLAMKEKRQKLSEVVVFHPEPGVGETEVVSDPSVNVLVETTVEEEGALQYRLTNFSVYSKCSMDTRHLLPINSALEDGKDIFQWGGTENRSGG